MVREVVVKARQRSYSRSIRFAEPREPVLASCWGGDETRQRSGADEPELHRGREVLHRRLASLRALVGRVLSDRATEAATTAVGSVKAAVEVVTAAARGGWGPTGRRGGG